MSVIKNMLHSMSVISLPRNTAAPKMDAEGKPVEKLGEIKVKKK